MRVRVAAARLTCSRSRSTRACSLHRRYRGGHRPTSPSHPPPSANHWLKRTRARAADDSRACLARIQFLSARVLWWAAVASCARGRGRPSMKIHAKLHGQLVAQLKVIVRGRICCTCLVTVSCMYSEQTVVGSVHSSDAVNNVKSLAPMLWRRSVECAERSPHVRSKLGLPSSVLFVSSCSQRFRFPV